MKWGDTEVQDLRALWDMGFRPTRIARVLTKRWHVAVTRNMIIGKSRDLNLHYEGGKPMAIAKGHPASVNARTLFQSRVRDPVDQILKSGRWNRKLGTEISKGRWKGMPIYSLSLEERATCPRSCAMWSCCYGNHMHNANRYRHGPELEAKLDEELAALQKKHPKGFVVRLHVLGDFYSPEYVLHWGHWLTKYPALRVFGYTAWPAASEVGQVIGKIRELAWDRFAVRTSGADEGPRTITVLSTSVPEQGRLDLKNDQKVILCPVQTGKTASCGTCTLCWAAPERTIAFLRH